MGLAQADGAEKDHVGFLRHELQAEEVLDLEAVDFFRPIPAELFEGFDDGKAGGLDATFDGALAPFLEFTLDQSGQVLDVIPVLLGALLSQFGVVVLDEG